MRLGIVLDGHVVDDGGRRLARAAGQVEAAGLDLVWLRQDDVLVDPLAAVAWAAAATTGLRLGAEVALGDRHPVTVAEAAAVADLTTSGRLVLGLRAAPGAEGDLAEAVELVVRSHRPRPFRHEGPRWPTPAGLEANTFTRDTTVRVTPATAQPELPTWIVGAPEVATRLGLPAVLPVGAGPVAHDDLRTLSRSRPGRVAVPVVDGRLDHDELVARLEAGRSDAGLDTALLELPVGPDDATWPDHVRALGRLVRPRVQQASLPPALVAWWDDQLRPS